MVVPPEEKTDSQPAAPKQMHAIPFVPPPETPVITPDGRTTREQLDVQKQAQKRRKSSMLLKIIN